MAWRLMLLTLVALVLYDLTKIQPRSSAQVHHVSDSSSASRNSTTTTASTMSTAATGSVNIHNDTLQAEKQPTMTRGRMKQLKVPVPIFVPSLPKSGTSTVHKYFRCGGQKSAHLFANRKKIGSCVEQELKQGIPPFTTCVWCFLRLD